MRFPGTWTVPLLAATAAAVSCGYRPIIGQLPGDVRAVTVPLVQNETPYAGLAVPLTGALRLRLAQGGVLVRDKASAKSASIEVRILKAAFRPEMLAVRGDRAVSALDLWTIAVEASLRGPSGEVLVGPMRFVEEGTALTGSSAAATEALGQRQRNDLLGALADRLVRAMLEQ